MSARRQNGREGATVIPGDRRSIHQGDYSMQEAMLIDGKLPRDLGAREVPRDIDLDRAPGIKPIQRRVELRHQQLVGYGQPLVPDQPMRLPQVRRWAFIAHRFLQASYSAFNAALAHSSAGARYCGAREGAGRPKVGEVREPQAGNQPCNTSMKYGSASYWLVRLVSRAIDRLRLS
jgi:hypothetical protein